MGSRRGAFFYGYFVLILQIFRRSFVKFFADLYKVSRLSTRPFSYEKLQLMRVQVDREMIGFTDHFAVRMDPERNGASDRKALPPV